MNNHKKKLFILSLSNFIFILLIISCRHNSENLTESQNSISSINEKLNSFFWQEIIIDKNNPSKKFSQPRAVGVSKKGLIYVIDRSGKIFVFNNDVKFLFDFPLPDFDKGTPTGMGFDNNDNILIPDTHYSRILIFNSEGKEIKRFGEYGASKGKLIYPTDITIDKKGNFYVTDYGDEDKVIKFDGEGNYIKEWGKRGDGEGELYRPMAIDINSYDELFIADSCNHRIQCFSTEGDFIRSFGQIGSGKGELKYPYDLSIDNENNVYVIEYGNSRISKFTREGKFVDMVCSPGSDKFQLHTPWGISVLNQKYLLAADTLNHRVVMMTKF
jgi:DNA-binding beta-propeller fold protein YncE